MMMQELKISRAEYGEQKYYPAISGQIELLKLTDSLSVLKIYFRKLRIVEKTSKTHFENSTEVMLSNFPINISSLEELNGMELFVDKGFEGIALTTMLSINDGEPINKSKIKFTQVKPDCFDIEWTGCWGDGNSDNENFKLKMLAYKEDNVITPLCEWERNLIEKFDHKK